MTRYIWTFFVFLLLTTSNIYAATPYGCPSQVAVKYGFSNQIQVDSVKSTHQLQPEFFGFNLEWVGFQWSLWDNASNLTRPDVVEWLKVFAGAVYRYPGGTISNHVSWHDTVGDQQNRPSKKFVEWMKPFTAKFGVKEYFNFIQAVNGKAWYVINMYGDSLNEISPTLQANDAGKLSKYLSENHNDIPSKILRWEFGNELDRGVYQWSPEKLTSISRLVATEIRKNDAQAKFVSTMQEYSAQANLGINASEYNRSVASGIKGLTNEYAMHVYYDGKPGGQPIPDRVNAICKAVQDAQAISPEAKPTIWLTEHARVPPNAWVDPNWKKDWPRTADLEAAIGVSDLMIAATQIPAVQGAFVHSLHGTSGPWPLFHLEKSTNNIHPSAVFWALKILRESMLEQVLPTSIRSGNSSGYDGGYDLRATVMTNSDHTKYSVWLINRSKKTITTNLAIPSISNQTLEAEFTQLTDSNIAANNYVKADRVKPLHFQEALKFDKLGSTNIAIPPHSISAISFPVR